MKISWWEPSTPRHPVRPIHYRSPRDWRWERLAAVGVVLFWAVILWLGVVQAFE
jgi:hypothetical protein